MDNYCDLLHQQLAAQIKAIIHTVTAVYNVRVSVTVCLRELFV